MKWGTFIGVMVIIAAIFAYEWPRMKQLPKKDKAAFIALLSIGWILTLFDLQNMAGPATVLETIFKPFSKLLDTR
ncbi:hypothetical protein GRF59_18940 [Paenibacillus sp. HJL G12]|uniref:Uncharacterized protein n=1 Tax=Paenibacillus dendrobii TaxID=2691084 RepID=A0A7X3LJS2_9BACL|nr:hypothetical protein [Paenibacillus dendrobii]MWV45694.1 hypothetical protein [Paenibacillus dendrobii]